MKAPWRRALIVEDDIMAVHTLERMIRTDYALQSALDGRDALARLRAETYDLVLCDMELPGMSGMELLQTLEAEGNANARCFLFVTGGAIRPAIEAFLDARRDRVVTKPFRKDDLRARIESLFGPLG